MHASERKKAYIIMEPAMATLLFTSDMVDLAQMLIDGYAVYAH